MARINERVLGQYKDLFFKGFYNLLECSRSVRPSWTGREKRVPGEEVTVIDKTQTAWCVSGCVQNFKMNLTE